MIRLFKVFIPVGTLTLLISEVLLVTSAFIFATYLVLEVDPTVFLLYDGGLSRIALVRAQHPGGPAFSRSLYPDSRQIADRPDPAALPGDGRGIPHPGTDRLRQRQPARAHPRHGRGQRHRRRRHLLLARLLQHLRASGGGPRSPAAGRRQPAARRHRPVHRRTSGDRPRDRRLCGRPAPARHARCPAARRSAPWSSLRDIVRATQPHRIVVGMFERRNRMPVGELLELRFAGQHHRRGRQYLRARVRPRLPEGNPALAAHLLRRIGARARKTCSTSGSRMWSSPWSGSSSPRPSCC